MGPWQKTATAKGFPVTLEEEAKTSEIRKDLFKGRADLIEQTPSWLLEQHVEHETGQPAESVKLTLPACGCPPSYSRSSKRKRSALRDYLFDIRPRAPPPKSKSEKRLDQQNKQKRVGVSKEDNRQSKVAAEAAFVQPSEDPGSEILAKEDWEEARRQLEGGGVDAQIRALLGVVSRRVELEHHQERQWLQTDFEVDKAGRDSHTNHTVPRAIRCVVQDMGACFPPPRAFFACLRPDPLQQGQQLQPIALTGGYLHCRSCFNRRHRRGGTFIEKVDDVVTEDYSALRI